VRNGVYAVAHADFEVVSRGQNRQMQFCPPYVLRLQQRA